MEQPGSEDTSYQSPDLPQAKLSDIFSSARDYSSQGSLYAGIEDGLQYLAQKFGEDKLFLGPPEAQIPGSYFGLPDLIPVTGLTSAAAALQGIITQGEGARGITEDSHYGKFFGIREEYEQVLKQDPKFEPGRPVIWNPYSMFPQDVSDTADVNLIEDPFAIDISNLFDGCYELFTELPSAEEPRLRLIPLQPREEHQVCSLKITLIPVAHSVPAVGFSVSSSNGRSFFYTGDTNGEGLAEIWQATNPDLVIVETTFPDSQEPLARLTHHMTPDLLEQEVCKLQANNVTIPRIIVVHMHPQAEEEIVGELDQLASRRGVTITVAYEGMVIEV